MAGRFFDSGNPFGEAPDPWTRVGNVDVTTTLAVVAAGVVSMFIWAVEGPTRGFSKLLWLVSENPVTGSVSRGQFWRLVTWPIPNEPDFWTVLLFVFFFIFGSQVERTMGRKPFMWFLLLLTVIPAVLVTLVEVVGGLSGGATGLNALELGVITAWAAQYPMAKFFGIIPAPVGVGVIIALDVLRAVGDRNNFELIIVLTTVVVALVGIRSFGHAPEVPQIPKVALPGFMTGQAQPRRQGTLSKSKPKKRSKGRGKLKSVPPPTPGVSKYQSSASADQEMDALLDQVADQGFDSLTKDQKKRLQDHSKRLRDGRDE